MRLRLIIAAAGMGAALVAGAARADPHPAAGAPLPEDPFEASNRKSFSVQQGFDHAVLYPLARFFSFLTPGPIGKAIHNLVTNLSEPVVIANDILQGRMKDAGRETLRVTANSTAGWLGLMDVAAGAGLARKDNDFGTTLGVWGVKSGPYLYLPLLGPSTPRDLVGMGGDVALNPLTWVRFPGHQTLMISSAVVGGLDTRIRAEPGLQSILGEAADPYATLRSVYLQNREAQIRGEAATPELPPMEEEPSAAPPADQSQAPPPSTDQSAPPASDQPPPSTQPTSPPPTAATGAAARFASAADDPDAPIATARACDLVGVATSPGSHGA